jgi:recombination protein RecA
MSPFTEALQDQINRINKKVKGSKLGSLADICKPVPFVLSTGSLAVDIALGITGEENPGCFGMPGGRIIEIKGLANAGKTTAGLNLIRSSLALGKGAALLETETSMDPSYPQALGIDPTQIVYDQPLCLEDALNKAYYLAETGAFGVIVVDSLVTRTRAEIEGAIGDSHVGIAAREIGEFLRKVAPVARANDTMIVLLNQIRMKVGVMFGNPETTPGGLALQYFASVRLSLRPATAIKRGDDIIGHEVKAKIEKSKLGRDGRTAIFSLTMGQGIDDDTDLLNMGIETQQVKRSGPWYLFGEKQLGQGKASAVQFLKDNPDVREDIRDKIIASASNISPSEDTSEESDAD